MASISLAFRKQIERLIQERPLEEGEFRRIEGAGSHYLSLQSEHGEQSYFFSMTIGDKEIYLYKVTDAK